MRSVHKSQAYRGSENGFVLMAAIIGMMILMAVGFLALTVSSDDLKISARIFGERKAFSAAEAGVHDVCLTFEPAMAAMNNVAIDAANDPNVSYSVTAPVPDPTIPTITAVGSSIEGGKSWSYNIFNSIVTGRYASHGSTVSLDVGLRHGEVPSTPTYQ